MTLSDAEITDGAAWSVTLPWPDLPALGGNTRYHWTRQTKAIRDARFTAALMAGQADWLPNPHGPVKMTVQFCPPDHRRRDPDNMLRASKAYIDGLVDAGVISDDTFKVVRELHTTTGDVVKGGEVRMTIAPVSTDA